MIKICKTTKYLLVVLIFSTGGYCRAALDSGLDSTFGAIDKLGPQTGMDEFVKDQESIDNASIPELKNGDDLLQSEDLPKFKLEQVTMEGNVVLTTQELEKFWAAYVGSEIDLTDLKKIAKDMTRFYREQGYFLSYVAVPAQTIKDGKVKFIAVEGYVHNIEVIFEDNKRHPSKKLEKILKNMHSQKPLKQSVFERYI